ncbi:ATP-dependent RecD-like DNA helicase, partial [Mesomycoplasma hyorhinis]
YIYIYNKNGTNDDDKVKKRDITKIWKQAKNHLKNESNYKFLISFYDILSKDVIHIGKTDNTSERLIFYFLNDLNKIKKIAYEEFSLELIKDIDKLNQYVISNVKEYYKKIVDKLDKLDRQNKYNAKTADIFIKDKNPFFWKYEDGLYYKLSFLAIEDYNTYYNSNNKKNNIIAYSKIDFKLGYFSKISYIEDTIQIQNQSFNFYVITDWKVIIQESDISYFINRIKNSDVLINKLELEQICLYLTKYRLNLLDLMRKTDYKSDYEDLKKELKIYNSDNSILDFLKYLNEEIKKNNKWITVIKYILCNFNTKNIKAFLPKNDKNLDWNDNIDKKAVYFNDFPLNFNPPKLWTLGKDLNCILDENKDYTAEKFASEIKQYSHNENKIFYKLNIEDEKLQEKKELINHYNKIMPVKNYKTNEKMECIGKFNNHLFIYEFVYEYFAIKNKILNFSKKSTYENYKKNAEQWIKNNEKSQLYNINNEKKEILLKIFNDSDIGFIYGPAGTGKTRLLEFINEITGYRTKLFLAQTNPAINNLKKRIKGNNQVNNFLTIYAFKNQVKEYKLNPTKYKSNPIKYDLLIIDECSVISNKDIKEILEIGQYKQLIFVGDDKQIESIRFGNWFKTLLKTQDFKDDVYELKEIIRAKENEKIMELWKKMRSITQHKEMDRNNTLSNIYQYIINNDFYANLDNIFLEKSEEPMEEIILSLNYGGLFGINNINNYLQSRNNNKLYEFGFKKFKKGDPVLFNKNEQFFIDRKKPIIIPQYSKGKILNIDILENDIINFDIELSMFIDLKEDNLDYNDTHISNSTIYEDAKNTVARISVEYNKNSPNKLDLPFELAYAVSIHKAQGLEYDSVKIVFPDDVAKQISFNIFYTAITRAKKRLKIYWPPKTDWKILSSLTFEDNEEELKLLDEYEKMLYQKN